MGRREESAFSEVWMLESDLWPHSNRFLSTADRISNERKALVKTGSLYSFKPIFE